MGACGVGTPGGSAPHTLDGGTVPRRRKPNVAANAEAGRRKIGQDPIGAPPRLTDHRGQPISATAKTGRKPFLPGEVDKQSIARPHYSRESRFCLSNFCSDLRNHPPALFWAWVELVSN